MIVSDFAKMRVQQGFLEAIEREECQYRNKLSPYYVEGSTFDENGERV